MKKRFDEFQKNQLKMGEVAKIDFDKEVFQVLSGGADELKFYTFEQRIRQIVNEQAAPLLKSNKELRAKVVG